jgi:hypothetical protein
VHTRAHAYAVHRCACSCPRATRESILSNHTVNIANVSLGFSRLPPPPPPHTRTQIGQAALVGLLSGTLSDTFIAVADDLTANAGGRTTAPTGGPNPLVIVVYGDAVLSNDGTQENTAQGIVQNSLDTIAQAYGCAGGVTGAGCGRVKVRVVSSVGMCGRERARACA